jgi:hypothetical protein
LNHPLINSPEDQSHVATLLIVAPSLENSGSSIPAAKSVAAKLDEIDAAWLSIAQIGSDEFSCSKVLRSRPALVLDIQL